MLTLERIKKVDHANRLSERQLIKLLAYLSEEQDEWTDDELRTKVYEACIQAGIEL